MEVTQTRGGREIESDIYWDGLGRYTESETEYQIANNAQTRDFVKLKGPWDVEVYKAHGEDQIMRRNQGKRERPFRNFKEN